MRTTTQLSIDQLKIPEDDVRTQRPDGQVRSIASSMGDPDVGQLQPILAYPVDHDDLEIDSADDLDQLVRDGHRFEILDGTTRYLAARDHLKWSHVWTWIHDSPPKNPTIARIDANNERISMTQYETVKAVCLHKQETGRTWQEVGEDTGWDPSYLSQVNSALNGPDWVVEPWQDPQVPIETGHALELMKAHGPGFISKIVELSDLDEDQAEQRAESLGQNLLGWAIDYQWPVGELRKAREQRQRELLDEIATGTPEEDPQTAAEKAKADSLHGAPVNQEAEPTPCLVCGARATTKVAIDVCDADRGMLNDQLAKGEPLMAPQETPTDDESDPIAQLAQATGKSPDEVRAFLEAQ